MTNYQTLDEKKQFYNRDTWRVVNTTAELKEILEDFTKLKNSKQHALFRGICEAKYKLYTSLQRECFSNNINVTVDTPRKIIKELLRQAYDSSNGNILPAYYKQLGIPLNDWLLLAILQHYGAPSPLLDFTKDFYPALYFMCLGMAASYSTNEIDHYFSIVYFKGVDACGQVIENLPKTGLTLYQALVEKPTEQAEREQVVRNNLSFEKVMGNRPLELIPSYKGVTNIRPKNNKWSVNIPISNLNMVSQEGEFICNISHDKPIEELMTSRGNNYLHCINIHKSLYHYIVDKYLEGSLDRMRQKLFPTEYQVAQNIYHRTMSNLFI